MLAALLPSNWDAQQVYDHHEVLMLHGQRCCFHRNPDCGRCVLLDLCPTGQARLARATTNVVGLDRSATEAPVRR